MKESQPDRDHSQAALAPELHHCLERVGNLKECFRIAAMINSSLELEEVLEHIMSTSRQILKADACSLMLVDEKTDELVFEVAQGPVADQLKAGFRVKKGQGIAGYVFETGNPVLIEDAYADPRFSQDFDLKTGYRTKSVLCVPLKAKERIIGVSQVINRLDGAPFTAEDEETLHLLCSSAGVAIETARMHRALLRKQQIESDLAFARNIQLSFLPRDVPGIGGYRFIAHYQAAHEVGGDFYDFIPLDEGRLGILIGDVSGKGVAAALYMAKLTSDFRLLAIRHKEPSHLVGLINDLLCERSFRGMFVTLIYLVLDTVNHSIRWINAGHIPPLLWNRNEKRVTMLRERGGPPTGILPGLRYKEELIRLSPGDCLLLATDGLIEAKNPEGKLFGLSRLDEIVRGGGSRLDALYVRITDAVSGFVQGRRQSDDITMILLGLEAAQ